MGLLTIVETIQYQRDASGVLDSDEQEELKLFLASNPEAGVVIRETGGLRKLRWAASGRGKRGGARVIYYYHTQELPLYLIAFVRKEPALGPEPRPESSRGKVCRFDSTRTQEKQEMSVAGKKILAGLQEALRHARGEETGARVTIIAVPDVLAIRKKLGFTQEQFARSFGVSLGTLRNWEQGQRLPEGPARVLLTVIDREPAAVKRALTRAVAAHPPRPTSGKRKRA